MIAPSGAQYQIVSGALHAVVVEVGGGLRELGYRDHKILQGYAVDEMASGASGQVLIPWPNRVSGGRYVWNGRELQLYLSEPKRANAIHGLVRWSAWQASEFSHDRIVMTHRLHPQPGYPFSLDLRIEYQLGEAGLAVTLNATNLGVAPLPFGAGIHPYLSLGDGPVDECELLIPASTYLQTDEDLIPTATHAVDGTRFDFRQLRRIGATVLDTAYTGLDRHHDGRAMVHLRRGAHHARVWMDQAFSHVMAFSGDTLEQPARRRSLAVEPMTCPPNAFRTGEGVIRLEPGEEWVARWGIAVD